MKLIRQRERTFQPNHGGTQNANDQEQKAEPWDCSGVEVGKLQGMVCLELSARSCTVRDLIKHNGKHRGQVKNISLNPATSQAQNQDFEVVLPNIQFIYELLEHVKGTNSCIQTCKTSVTQTTTGYPR